MTEAKLKKPFLKLVLYIFDLHSKNIISKEVFFKFLDLIGECLNLPSNASHKLKVSVKRESEKSL